MQIKRIIDNVKIINEIINVTVNEYPIFVTYYTVDNGYKQFFDKLHESLKKFSLNYHVFEILRENNEWETICQKKPNFLLEVMNNYPTRNIVWIDSDAIIEKSPDLFLKINKDLGFFYLGPELCSGTLFFKNSKLSKKILNEWIEQTTVINKLYIKNKFNRHNLYDQVILQKLITNKGYKKHVFNIGVEYVAIFDHNSITNKHPVISHWQASRKLKYKNSI